jgi:tRNA modification GTPase
VDLKNLSKNDTIIAPATSPGMGAIAVIRISGPKAISYTQKFFNPYKSGKNLAEVKTHTAHFGEILDQPVNLEIAEDQPKKQPIDEVLINVFHDGKSFTGEETVEISCHGSTYITQTILQLFVDAGVRAADAGEFTMRAYRNGKFDLSQAEAVADLIHSTSKASSQLALSQLKGGVSSEISKLREQLLNFASLIELELDFSEEDVEFADRSEFIILVGSIQKLVGKLMTSFSLGNAIKNGLPVAIVGEPNVGKSTLLNALLEEDRAIVSSIAGTTRDVIEDELNIEGVKFRFIDTAGIRETNDEIETKGIEKTFQKMDMARVVMQVFDVTKTAQSEIEKVAQALVDKYPEKEILIILNKVDLLNQTHHSEGGTTEETLNQSAEEDEHAAAKRAELNEMLGTQETKLQFNLEFQNKETITYIPISAKSEQGIQKIKNKLTSLVDLGQLNTGDIIISNARHYNSLKDANLSLDSVLNAMQIGMPGDLLAIDIRAALHSLGEITGEITTDDLLGNIFGKFCIGK